MAPKIQWPLVLFSMLAGCGGCAFAFAGVANLLGESVEVTLFATVVSFVFCVVGGLFSVKHLATPKHALWAIQHLLSFSGISVELIMLGLTCALQVVYIALCCWTDAPLVRAVVGVAGVVCGLGLAFATGHGYLISSKPTWNTKKLPVSYLTTSMVSGGFLYLACAVPAGADATVQLPLELIEVACVVLSVVSVMAYMRHIGPERAHYDEKLYTYGIVVCGMVVPAACCLLMPLAGNAVAVLGFVLMTGGLAASIAGGIALRSIMWIVGAGFLNFFEEARTRRSVLMNY